MGILTFVGLEFMPDETLVVDTQMLKQKILDKKSNALGFDYTGENNLTCITFSRDALNLDENLTSKTEVERYKFKSQISVSGLKNGNRVCFDTMGRPFDGEVDKNLTNLLHNYIIIELKYRNKKSKIILYPITGALKASL
jgi:hypothetical protein